jgi:hypothetical protein
LFDGLITLFDGLITLFDGLITLFNLSGKATSNTKGGTDGDAETTGYFTQNGVTSGDVF